MAMRKDERMTAAVSKWVRLPSLLVVFFLAEQWSKFLAVGRLTTAFARSPDAPFHERVRAFYTYRHLQPLAREPYAVWNDYWRMAYAENPGSAFGLFGMWPPTVRFALFTLVTSAAVAFILGMYGRAREDQRVRQISLVLVLAGR